MREKRQKSAPVAVLQTKMSRKFRSVRPAAASWVDFRAEPRGDITHRTPRRSRLSMRRWSMHWAAWLHAHLHPSSGGSTVQRWRRERWKHQERRRSLGAVQSEIDRTGSLTHELMNDWANTSPNCLPITILLYTPPPRSLCLFIYPSRAAWDQRGEVMNGTESYTGQRSDSVCVK